MISVKQREAIKVVVDVVSKVLDHMHVTVKYQTKSIFGFDRSTIESVDWGKCVCMAKEINQKLHYRHVDTGKYVIVMNYNVPEYSRLLTEHTDYLAITCFLLDLAFGMNNDKYWFSRDRCPQRLDYIITNKPSIRHKIIFTEQMHQILCKRIRKLVKEKHKL